MPDLRVTLFQRMLHWEDAEANRSMFERDCSALNGITDLVVLPEMFTTGFTMRSVELAETMDGRTVQWMKAMARLTDAAWYGSLVVLEHGAYYNRGLFITPDGQVRSYDKRHLFRMANEHEHYAQGRERVVVEWRGWRILLQICYDLRFPVFSRARNGDYDLALYVANWPEARRHPWTRLLEARAIENLACVVGVNRVGMDGKGVHYSGDSAAIDARGEPLVQLGAGRESTMTVVLDRHALEEFRQRFPAHLDADDFLLR